MGFNSWKDFQTFESDVKLKNRFVHSAEVLEFFLNVKRTLPARERPLATGSILHRGQLGYDEDESEGGTLIRGFNPKRMKPIPNKGTEGRANPKGISYLYLSNDENTALAELRPHLGQNISSAQFKVQKDLRIVDCYSVPHHYSHIRCFFDPPTSQDEIGNAIWSLINDAFSKPVNNVDQSADYVPTQILAEYFKSQDFNGVCFKSSMGIGYNYILFDLNDAELVNCTVMETTALSYEFKECTNRYYVGKNLSS